MSRTPAVINPAGGKTIHTPDDTSTTPHVIAPDAVHTLCAAHFSFATR